MDNEDNNDFDDYYDFDEDDSDDDDDDEEDDDDEDGPGIADMVGLDDDDEDEEVPAEEVKGELLNKKCQVPMIFEWSLIKLLEMLENKCHKGSVLYYLPACLINLLYIRWEKKMKIFNR